MARQIGDIKIVGTIDEICFYKMEGDYFARQKSSLTGRRFWKDRVFEGSRKSCGRMAKASPLASRLYHTMPKEQKGREVFRALVGKVKIWMKNGWQEDKIQQWFLETYFPPKKANRKRCQVPQTRSEVKAPIKRGLSNLFVIFYCNRNPNRKQGEFLSMGPINLRPDAGRISFLPAGPVLPMMKLRRGNGSIQDRKCSPVNLLCFPPITQLYKTDSKSIGIIDQVVEQQAKLFCYRR